MIAEQQESLHDSDDSAKNNGEETELKPSGIELMVLLQPATPAVAALATLPSVASCRFRSRLLSLLFLAPSDLNKTYLITTGLRQIFSNVTDI